jgi:hypothetical protein
MHFLRTGVLICAVAVALSAGPDRVVAQSGPGFRFAFGWQDMAGDMGDVLDGAVDAEFSITHPVKAIRLGAGANWVSFAMDDFEESWSQVRFHFLVGYPYQVNEWLRPYIEGRAVYRRLRPEGDRYYGGPEVLLGDFKASGASVEGVVGTEFLLGPRAAIDVSAAMNRFSVSPDLSDEGLGPIDSGMAWRFHVGVAWYPVNER